MRILAALVAVSSAFVAEDALWEQYKQQYAKRYASAEEEASRRAVFAKNVAFIAEHNAKQAGYELEVNQYADQTADEFSSTYFGLKTPSLRKQWGGATHLGTHVKAADEATPASVDWTTKGAVTPVKNQGQCGSCWSFSTTGSLEGRAQIATGKLTSLAEQQFVDCDTVDNGCNGGLMDNAFQYAEKNDLCTEESYAYKAARGSCAASSCTVGLKKGSVVGFKDVGAKEEDLESAVAQGPVSVAIEADKQVFQFYKSGVLSGECGATLDHGVLVVGYGEENGQKYWKVKNSWGATWGENGYIKLLKGKKASLPFLPSVGECGILKKASYPVIGGTEEKASNDVKCEDCEKVATLALNVAKMAEGELTVDSLKALCAKLPKEAEQKACDLAVALEGQKIIDAVKAKLDGASAQSICSAVKLCPAAAMAAATSHYEKPPCQSDEMEGQISGASGVLCAPKCNADASCPTDVPAGTTATPMCALQSQAGDKYCALVCKADSDCATGASCAQLGGAGLCVYPASSELSSSSVAQFTAVPTKEVVEVVLGLAEGFFLSGDQVEEQCIDGASVMFKDIESAIAAFRTKTASGVKQGLEELADALKELPTTLTACKQEEKDVAEMIASLKAFKSPTAFAYHVGKDILVNGRNIIKEIAAAIQDWEAKSYKDFGVQVGTALRQVIVGVEYNV